MHTDSSLSLQPTRPLVVPSNRRFNRFVHHWFKDFRKRQWKENGRGRAAGSPWWIASRDESVAYDVAERYIRALVGRSVPEFRDVMMPWIKNLVMTEGFPVDAAHRDTLLDSLVQASDFFRDMDKGLFGFTGLDTHYILEHMVHHPEKITRLLKRVHPDDQHDFCAVIQIHTQAQEEQFRMQALARYRKFAPAFIVKNPFFVGNGRRQNQWILGSSL